MANGRHAVGIKGEEVLKRAARKNLTARELAARCGISAAYLSYILAGERTPTPLFRKRLMAALRCRWDEVFYSIEDTENKRPPMVATPGGGSEAQ